MASRAARTGILALVAGAVLVAGCGDESPSASTSTAGGGSGRSRDAFCTSWRDVVLPKDRTWQSAQFGADVAARAPAFDAYLAALEAADRVAPEAIRSAHEANLAFLTSISRPHYERYGWDLQPQTADPTESAEYNRALQSNLDDLQAIASYLQANCGISAADLGG